MPKPLDVVLKEAVAHKTEEYQKEFLSSSKEEQIKLLNEENQKLENNIDILSEGIVKIKANQENKNKSWHDDIPEVLIGQIAEVLIIGGIVGFSAKMAAITLGPIGFTGGYLALKLYEHYSSGQYIIDDSVRTQRELNSRRGKVFLAIQELGGERKATDWDKRKEERQKAAAKAEDKKKERKAFDQKIREKRKKKISIGSDVSGFIGNNENVEPSKSETFTPYTMPSMTAPQAAPADAELRKTESVTSPEIQAQPTNKEKVSTPSQQPQKDTATPKTTPQANEVKQDTTLKSNYLPEIKMLAGLTPKEIKDLVMKQYEGMDLTDRKIIVQINDDIVRARQYSNYAKEYLKLDGDYSTPKDRKELEDYLFKSEYHAPFIEKVFGINTNKSTTSAGAEGEDIGTPASQVAPAKQLNSRGETQEEALERGTNAGIILNRNSSTVRVSKGQGAEGEDLGTPSASTTPPVPATPKAPMGAGAEGEDLGTPSTSTPPPVLPTPKAPVGAGAEREDLGTPSASTPPPVPATSKISTDSATSTTNVEPKSTQIETQPKDTAEPKQSSYDEEKVRAHMESLAKETDKELSARIKKQIGPNASGLTYDIQKDEAEERRSLAKDYLRTTRNVKARKEIEAQFVGEIPGIDPKDHAQHLVEALDKNNTQSKKENYTTETPQSSTATAAIKPENSNTKKVQPNISEESGSIEPKMSEPTTTSLPTELSASTKKSGGELDAVRQSMVEDKMSSQQSQQPIVVPVPIPLGGRSAPIGGGDGNPSDSLIPMVIVNDEEIIRMNSFEAYKLRMI